jgi:carboxypeptidase family protein
MTRSAFGSVAFALAMTAHAGLAGQVRPEIVPIDPLTAAISGRVTSETGGPLRRAEIRATSNGGLSRYATTDPEGRYVVRDLPAGTFTLHVSKSGFVPLYFGQRRPFERRTTISLVPGQRVSADIRLPRAGAITGRIVDRTGEPVMGARVQALRRRMVNGQRGLQAVGAADTTDDTGAYRVYGLPPGDYYVTATTRGVEDRAGRPVPPILGQNTPTILGGNTPIFYPGTANRDEAQRVAVDVGVEGRADLVLTEVRTSRLSGVVLSSSGTPAAGAMVSLLSRDLSFGGDAVGGVDPLVPLQIQDDADASGRFELRGVPPGSFTLRVNTRPTISMPFDPVAQRFTARPVLPPMETAMVPVNVDGDVAGLTVTTSGGATVDVVLVPDQGVSAPLPDNVRFTARSTDGNSMSLMIMDHSGSVEASNLTVGAAGTSASASMSSRPVASIGLQGPTRVAVDGLPEQWAVKAILLDNEDFTDRPIELRDNQPKTLRVVLTDRVTGVVGSVGSSSFADSGASAQAIVLVFADDEKRWTYPSRFIRTARSDRGRFEVTGLPANEEYRAVAVDFLEDGEEYDLDFLKRMRERAARFSLREGERVAIDLRLIQR